MSGEGEGLVRLSHRAQGSVASTSHLLGKRWAGRDAGVEGTTETIQTQPQPCHAMPGTTRERPCVWESTDVRVSDEFKAFSFSIL